MVRPAVALTAVALRSVINKLRVEPYESLSSELKNEIKEIILEETVGLSKKLNSRIANYPGKETSERFIQDAKALALSKTSAEIELFVDSLKVIHADEFEGVLLEPEQKDLLIELAQAARNVSGDSRQPFMVIQSFGSSEIIHPGLPSGKISGYEGDVGELDRAGFVSLSYGSGGTPRFDVTSLGFKYYEYLKRKQGQPVERLEATIRKSLDFDRFRESYGNAYNKWAEAEALLWKSDSEHEFTTIGHLCREAIHEFATALIDHYKPPEVESDKTKTVARIKAVLDLKAKQLGGTEKAFLEALLPFWGTVSDLVQRQEHGAQKEGKPLVWEDGRRVVFQTAVLMYEIDSSLSR